MSSPTRAGTRIALGDVRHRHARPSCRSMRHPSPCARRRSSAARRAGVPSSLSAAVRTASPSTTPGSSAARCSSVPNSAIGSAHGDERVQQRHRRDRAALLLRGSGTARGSRSRPPPTASGQRDAEQVGLGQLGPGVAVEPVGRCPRARAGGSSVHAVGEDLARPGRAARCCSSVRVKSIGVVVSSVRSAGRAGHAQAEDGDEVALHLVGATAEGEDEHAAGARLEPAAQHRLGRVRPAPAATGPTISIRSRKASR